MYITYTDKHVLMCTCTILFTIFNYGYYPLGLTPWPLPPLEVWNIGSLWVYQQLGQSMYRQTTGRVRPKQTLTVQSMLLDLGHSLSYSPWQLSVMVRDSLCNVNCVDRQCARIGMYTVHIQCHHIVYTHDVHGIENRTCTHKPLYDLQWLLNVLK